MSWLFDDADEGAGGPIEQLVRFACSARCLVVMVTAGIYDSPYIPQEIESDRLRRIRSWLRRPFSRMIPSSGANKAR